MRIDRTGLELRWRAVIVVVNATPGSWSHLGVVPAAARIALQSVLADATDTGLLFGPVWSVHVDVPSADRWESLLKEL